MGGKAWKKEELEYIEQNYETKTCLEIGELLGRTEASVQLISHRKGLNKRNGMRPDFALKEDEPKYGKLKILRKYVEDKTTKVECLCDCGNICTRNYKSLRDDITDDCGCERILSSYKHGLCEDPIYSHFHKMKGRCYNKNDDNYDNYGGRGIIICEEWLNDFKKFYDWAIENGYEQNKDLSIERVNNNGNYEPTNCKWATSLEQANNRRTNYILLAFGENKTISQWSRDERCKVCQETLRYRISNGWNVEKAICQEANKFNGE